MGALIILIPATLVLCLIAIGGIFWCLKNKQYDDIEGDAARIIIDDEN